MEIGSTALLIDIIIFLYFYISIYIYFIINKYVTCIFYYIFLKNYIQWRIKQNQKCDYCKSKNP